MKECPACHRCFADHLNHCPSDGDRLKFLINLDTTLDERYLLERKLGQGGMGLVFKAQHKFIKTQHAIKVILPDLVGNDPSLAARFRQEAMAAAAIRHPNTVSVTDYGILGGTTPYLVMEFVEGHSLHELLAEQKRLTPEAAVEIMLAVCAGVAAAHRQGIVHRDLKPLNIMLRPGIPPGESLKVLDFGLAKIKSGELLGSFVAAQTQGMMGSPFYMAPEQWGDDDIDVRADIYSLGVILYQMIAGDVPFKGKSVPAIMSMHLNTAPVPLSERGIEVPPLLERAVQHALEKDPEKRPHTVEDFAAELREAVPQLNGNAALREPGATTVQIGPTDTTGLKGARGFRTEAHAESQESLRTIAGGPDALNTGALEAEAGRPGASTVAEPPAARGTDTASHGRAQQTVGQFGAGDAASTQHFQQDALTEPLPASADALRQLEESRRAESLRRQAEEAQLRRQAEERERQESEARERREAEERQRLRAEEQQRREAEEAQRREAEEQRRREAEERAARQAGGAAAGGAASGAATPTRSRAPLIAVGAVVLLALIGVLAGVGYIISQRTENTNGAANANAAANTNAAANANAASNTNGGGAASRADLLWMPGGTFRMGRADVPPITDELKSRRAAYLLWTYSQWPAHEVTVGPFAIDRTEVTNGEYADFVRETGHAPPPGVWDGARPKPGEERMPITNVTYEDARAFAAWRSKRDGVTYRLPTEEEWEYAARAGDSERAYPWGSEWVAGYANLGATTAAQVGSFPSGRTPQGLEDMLGNVWEWTTSEASMYKGNDRTALAPEDRGKLVTRGGSYESRPDGDEPITVTARRWVPRNFRHPVLGFRLVRAGQ
ncbi:MAG: SUMF1/EgtB/PvdO family nonheme iron enzyme [Acidobacteria bacterium]|nr:SUMF1/EgtB/PvdO family nonheme iron enzyme [Acidobacteriota bacterium]